MMPMFFASAAFAPTIRAGGRASGAAVERARDELAQLEAELANLWPDTLRIDAELAAGEVELSALRAEVSWLEGTRRRLDLSVSGILAALAAFCAVAVYLLGVP
jgi:hypothetical protein